MVSIPTTQEPWWIELCKVSVDLSGVTSILCQFLLQDLQFQIFFDPMKSSTFMSSACCCKKHLLYKSKQPPSFYPDEFELWANAVLQHIGIIRDHITAQNCPTVYLKLIQYSNVYGLSLFSLASCPHHFNWHWNKVHYTLNFQRYLQ